MDKLPPSPHTPVSSTAGSFLSFSPDGPSTPQQRNSAPLDSADETPRAACRTQEAPQAFSLEADKRQPRLDLQQPPVSRKRCHSSNELGHHRELSRSASDSEDVFSDASYRTPNSGDSFESQDPFADGYARHRNASSSSVGSANDSGPSNSLSKPRDRQRVNLAPSFFSRDTFGKELPADVHDLADSDSSSSAWEDELYASLSEDVASNDLADRSEALDCVLPATDCGGSWRDPSGRSPYGQRSPVKSRASASPSRPPYHSPRRRRHVRFDPPISQLPARLFDSSPPLSAFRCDVTSPIGSPSRGHTGSRARQLSPHDVAESTPHRLSSPRLRASPPKPPRPRKPRKLLAPINTDELDRFFGVSTTRTRQLDEKGERRLGEHFGPSRPREASAMSNEREAPATGSKREAPATIISEEASLLGVQNGSVGESRAGEGANGSSANSRQRLRKPSPLELSFGRAEPSFASSSDESPLSPLSSYAASDDGSYCGEIDDSSSCLDAGIEYAAPLFIVSGRFTPQPVTRTSGKTQCGSGSTEWDADATDHLLPPDRAHQHASLRAKRSVAQRLRSLYTDLF